MTTTKKFLFELEVIYLKNNVYAGRKYDLYPEDEAQEMYMKVCGKYKEGGAIVVLRSSDGELIKSYKGQTKAIKKG
jgi:hypothetical protein